jgi:hypothetical protein
MYTRGRKKRYGRSSESPSCMWMTFGVSPSQFTTHSERGQGAAEGGALGEGHVRLRGTLEKIPGCFFSSHFHEMIRQGQRRHGEPVVGIIRLDSLLALPVRVVKRP